MEYKSQRMDDLRRGGVTRRKTWRGDRRSANLPPEADERTGARPRVILAEDDRSALAGLTQWLESEGFSVSSCASFPEARAALTARSLAALLTDVRLGEYNGLHLVQLARSLHPNARLVVFSGFADEVLESEAKGAGAMWLLKPLDLARLGAYLSDLALSSGGGETESAETSH